VNPGWNYLRLSEPYAEALGGLRWAPGDNVLEHRDGTCFLFAEQVAEFLEGFASVRPVLHFTLMTHLLALLRELPALEARKGKVRLWRTFLDSGRNLRNAGAFCAHLSASLPAAVEAGHLDEIRGLLRYRIVHWSVASAAEQVGDRLPMEAPPLRPEEFEAHILAALEAYSQEELTEWLRHGRGPVHDAAGALARLLPASLAGRLAALLERPRLAGAEAFLRQLSGALTLPPRRLDQRDMPIGGYADVATRGPIAQILPSQFALDEDDFFRRLAEHELLYFRREEPHEQTRQELVVLLDQGVRTWGDVRIVLGAALLAFGKQAIRRKLPFRVATSAAPTSVDPLELGGEALGRLVEASDLSPHPGFALERLLEEAAPRERDIVLLTHPRSLNEVGVRTAALRIAPGARLFALTLDRDGTAALSELRRGAPIAVREFQVDLSLAARPCDAAAKLNLVTRWQGDVEPVPFPFRFGIGGAIGPEGFDFDEARNFLLTASSGGMLHLWKPDGTLAEILPRGLIDGEVLRRVTAVLGVADGFAVVGLLSGSRPVILHYSLDGRRCQSHRLGDAAGARKAAAWQWVYARAHHCLIAFHQHAGFVVDLGTGEKYATSLGGPRNRAQLAWEAWIARQVPLHRLVIVHRGARSNMPWPCVKLDSDTGMVTLENVQPSWHAFTPMSEGRPMLQQQLLLDAQWRGGTLALKTSRLGRQSGLALRVFRGPEGIFLGEYSLAELNLDFTLSTDGQLLARQLRGDEVEIRDVDGTLSPLGRITVGKFPHRLWFVLGDDSIELFPGTSPIVVSWQQAGLVLKRGVVASKLGESATRETLPSFLKYDSQRWLLGARRRLWAASDRFGQVALFDGAGALVCMFFAFRNDVAGWMPDGTRFGPASLTGHAASPDALQKFARAIRAASDSR
jgi:hypothetical protein